MNKKMSTCTALVTPYNSLGIDYQQLKFLVERQINCGIDALLVNGSTGEPLLLTEEERETQAKFVINTVRHKIPVIVSCGGVSTIDTLNRCQKAQQLGADYVLVVTPYYNKTSQTGAVAHYCYIADNLSIPLIIYNVPSRTGFNLTPESVYTLSQHNNIVGIKEASGNVSQAIDLFSSINDNFALYCGDDALTIPLLSLGASGVISVISNACPTLIKQVVSQPSPQLAFRIKQMSDLTFCETNPIPIKYIMYRLGLLKEYYFRLPLVTLPLNKRKQIDQMLQLFEEYK